MSNEETGKDLQAVYRLKYGGSTRREEDHFLSNSSQLLKDEELSLGQIQSKGDSIPSRLAKSSSNDNKENNHPNIEIHSFTTRHADEDSSALLKYSQDVTGGS